MKIKSLLAITIIVSSLFYITISSVEAADVTISDGTGDVYSYDDQNMTLITNSPEIDIANIDINQTTYMLEGTQITLTLRVNGKIQDKGNLFDINLENAEDLGDLENFTINAIFYQFTVTTSSGYYVILYSNKTCNFTSTTDSYDLSPSDFSINGAGNTLTVTFPLTNAFETYESLEVESVYTNFNFIQEDFSPIYYSDMAPNPILEAGLADGITNIGSVGESIQFYGKIEPATGQPPFNYHWDFGDNSESDDILNPTHVYTKAGNYTYIFTVTDNSGETSNDSDTIVITQDGGGDGNSPSNLLNNFGLILAIFLIIIVIGIIVIVWIIRRR